MTADASALDPDTIEYTAALSTASEGPQAAPASARGPLDASPDGLATKIAGALRDRHPVTVFFTVLLASWTILAAASIAFGLVLTRGVLAIDAIAEADERFVQWLVSERTEWLVDGSWVGSTLAGGHVIPFVIATTCLVAVARRKWRVAGFVLFAVAVESATYRVTSIALPRERPDVPRLEGLPVDASYPSGHTAASVALFSGLALLASGRVHGLYVKVAIWALAIAIVPFVALSRMVRGMHHPVDVAGGVAVGIGALLCVLLAARVAGVAAARRDITTPTEGSNP